MEEFRMERRSDVPLHASRITCEGKLWRSRRNHRTGGLRGIMGALPHELRGLFEPTFIPDTRRTCGRR